MVGAPLIPAQLTLPPQEFEGLSWLAVAVKIAAKTLRAKVLAGAADDTAIIFYNTVRERCRRLHPALLDLLGHVSPPLRRRRGGRPSSKLTRCPSSPLCRPTPRRPRPAWSRCT